MKNKQYVDKSEPYFVHIGYTYVCELRKYKLKKYNGKWMNYRTMKMRPCVANRIAKLERYWRASLK